MMLSNFKINQSGIIKQIITNNEIKCRIKDLGIIPESKFIILGKALFNDPIMLKIDRCIIIIRKNEAKKIICEPI